MSTKDSQQTSAMIYSIVGTAKANGKDPHAYLSRVIEALPRATTLADVEALLPWAPPPLVKPSG